MLLSNKKMYSATIFSIGNPENIVCQEFLISPFKIVGLSSKLLGGVRFAHNSGAKGKANFEARGYRVLTRAHPLQGSSHKFRSDIDLYVGGGIN
jgi:hypothetical protein